MDEQKAQLNIKKHGCGIMLLVTMLVKRETMEEMETGKNKSGELPRSKEKCKEDCLPSQL